MSDGWQDIASMPLTGEFEVLTARGLTRRARPTPYSGKLTRFGSRRVWSLDTSGKNGDLKAVKWRPIEKGRSEDRPQV